MLELMLNISILIGIELVPYYVIMAIVHFPFPWSWVVIAVPDAILISILFYREWKKDKLIIQQIRNPWYYDVDAQTAKYLASHRKEVEDKS
jgi:hypothetical protein